MYYVYILYSETTGRYYTGSTEEITSRLKHHNGGYNRSTKSGVPWEVIRLIEVLDRTEALKLELKIKKRGAKRYLKDLKA